MNNYPPASPGIGEETNNDASSPMQRPSSDRRSQRNMASPRNTSSRKQTKRERKAQAAAAAAAAAQQEVIKKLTSLQLPHMPMDYMNNSNSADNKKINPPTLRILIVADIDLASASALAESALAASSGANDNINNINGRSSSESNENQNLLDRVDLCIACGPFCREEDLRHYYQGRQRRRHVQRINNHNNTANSYSSQYENRGYNHHGAQSYYQQPYPSSSFQQHQEEQHRPHGRRKMGSRQQRFHPLKRSREETAALEGLMTAALSQLESIVCRVIFVPGRTDPLTTIAANPLTGAAGSNLNHFNNSFSRTSSSSNPLPYTKERRLTPNSRNIHQQWMPLCPGLGCAGLLYLDWQQLQQPPPLEDEEDDDDDEDDDSSTSSLLHDDGDEFAMSSDKNLRGGDELDACNSSGEGSHSNYQYGQEDGDEDGGVPPSAVSASPSQKHAEQAKQYGTEFCNTLKRLVEIAPPISAVTDTPTNSKINGLLKTEFFQSILVTHFHHLEEEDDEDSDSEDDVTDSAPFDEYHQSVYGSTSSMRRGNMMTSSQYQPPPNNSFSDPNSYYQHQAPNFNSSIPHQQQSLDNMYDQPPPPPRSPTVDNEKHIDVEEQEEDEEEESFDPPWPTEHEAFCALPLVQEHVVLEIAAGRNSSGQTVKPMELPKGKVRVVLPGSLRERGEFCLVDVAFMKDDIHHQPKQNDYRWRVRKTRFQTINEFL